MQIKIHSKCYDRIAENAAYERCKGLDAPMPSRDEAGEVIYSANNPSMLGGRWPIIVKFPCGEVNLMNSDVVTV